MAAAGMLAGWASADITPPVPCWLGGYVARTGRATGVHDQLLAHALALGTRDRPLVLVVCDLVAVDATLLGQIRQCMPEEKLGATIWVGATHTHSGPDIGRGLATHAPDPQVEEKITTGIRHAVQQAIGTMQPAAANFASGLVSGIGGNRDHPHRPTHLSLDLVRFHVAGSADAVLGSFGCHPTVLGADNRCISADLPGAFRRGLLSRMHDLAWVALATGAAGDISTRHLRREQTFEEVERVGLLLAEQAIGIVQNCQPLHLSPPVVDRRVVQLKAKPSQQSMEYARLALERERAALVRVGKASQARTREVALQGLQLVSPHDQLIEAELSVARLGDLTLVAVPGELYANLGAAITAHTPSTLVLGYANGYIGYIPTRQAYSDALDYEVLASHIAPGEGEKLVRVASRLLDATRGGQV